MSTNNGNGDNWQDLAELPAAVQEVSATTHMRWRESCPYLPGGKAWKARPHPQNRQQFQFWKPQTLKIDAALLDLPAEPLVEFEEGGFKWVWIDELRRRRKVDRNTLLYCEKHVHPVLAVLLAVCRRRSWSEDGKHVHWRKFLRDDQVEKILTIRPEEVGLISLYDFLESLGIGFCTAKRWWTVDCELLRRNKKHGRRKLWSERIRGGPGSSKRYMRASERDEIKAEIQRRRDEIKANLEAEGRLPHDAACKRIGIKSWTLKRWHIDKCPHRKNHEPLPHARRLVGVAADGTEKYDDYTVLISDLDAVQKRWKKPGRRVKRGKRNIVWIDEHGRRWRPSRSAQQFVTCRFHELCNWSRQGKVNTRRIDVTELPTMYRYTKGDEVIVYLERDLKVIRAARKAKQPIPKAPPLEEPAQAKQSLPAADPVAVAGTSPTLTAGEQQQTTAKTSAVAVEDSSTVAVGDWSQARAAKFLKLHRGRINHLIKDGTLKTNGKKGRDCLITRTSILDYQERGARRKREEQRRRDERFA